MGDFPLDKTYHGGPPNTPFISGAGSIRVGRGSRGSVPNCPTLRHSNVRGGGSVKIMDRVLLWMGARQKVAKVF